MSTIKIAAWNIFFSFEIYRIRKGNLEINPEKSEYTGQTASIRRKREKNIVRIIGQLESDILGIVECMPQRELELFQEKFFPGRKTLSEGKGSQFFIGMMYNPGTVKVEKVTISGSRWRTPFTDDRSDKTYGWVRKPLVVRVTPKGKSKGFLVAVVHSKSKRKGKRDPASKDFSNRRQIVAEGMRIRELMGKLVKKKENAKHKEFIVMGDINDGPGYDSVERKLNMSGLESHIGSLLDPDNILYSFNDLSDGGERSTSFKTGQQIDHILMTRPLYAGESYPAFVKGSGKIDVSLVDIEKDGKRRDSDHAPVEMRLTV